MTDVNSTEVWKEIPGTNGIYQASSLGRIRSVDRYVKNPLTKRMNFKKGVVLKPQIKRKGYLAVTYRKNGKSAEGKVHRLVAIAFIPNPDNLPQVNHIDLDKSNNRVWNLEWSDQERNMAHAALDGVFKGYWGARMPNSSLRTIQLVIDAYDSGESSRSVGKRFGLDKKTVLRYAQNGLDHYIKALS